MDHITESITVAHAVLLLSRGFDLHGSTGASTSSRNAVQRGVYLFKYWGKIYEKAVPTNN